MRFAGNVIWFILGGAVTALFWLVGAAVFAISIIGIPLTRSAVEMAKLSAWPFGREVVHVRELDGRELDATTAFTGTVGFIFNVIWAVTFGLVLCLSYILLGIMFCITLIGIPFGLQAFKLAGISLWPVGRRVVTAELAHVARDHRAHEDFDRYRKKGRSEPPLTAKKAQTNLEPQLLSAAPARIDERPASMNTRSMPPQLAADSGWFVEVVGEADYQNTLATAARSSTTQYDGKPVIIVTIEPEDDNPHDAAAVRVAFKGRTLGYLPRPVAKQYRAALGERRASASALVHGGSGEDDDGEPMLFGIWLNASWPPRFK